MKSCTTCAYYSEHPCPPTSGEVGDCFADDRTIRKIWDTEARNCDGFGYLQRPNRYEGRPNGYSADIYGPEEIVIDNGDNGIRIRRGE